MSFLVTRPSRPVPVTVVGSIPCSEAIRATTGETKVCCSPPEPLPEGAGSAGAVGAVSGSADTGSGTGSGSEFRLDRLGLD